MARICFANPCPFCYHIFMDSINTKNLHHAYCIMGDAGEIELELGKLLAKELDFKMRGNPDFLRSTFDVFGIDDARAIGELHSKKPAISDRKIFVVSANFITEQAQNAMLKMFEEPRGDTHFFLIIPSANGIIPTLRSRMMFVEHEGKKLENKNAKKFLESSVGERFKEIKNLMDSIKDEEQSKIEVLKFINVIEKELWKSKAKVSSKIFEEIEKARSYAGDQSPSLKMILEHLALVIPGK